MHPQHSMNYILSISPPPFEEPPEPRSCILRDLFVYWSGLLSISNHKPFFWARPRMYLTHKLARFPIVSRPVAPRQWRGEWHGPFVHFRPVLTLSDFGGFLWTPLTTRWLKNWRWCPWWPPSQAARTRLDSGSELGSVSPRKCRHCRHMSRLR